MNNSPGKECENSLGEFGYVCRPISRHRYFEQGKEITRSYMTLYIIMRLLSMQRLSKVLQPRHDSVGVSIVSGSPPCSPLWGCFHFILISMVVCGCHNVESNSK